MCPIMMPSAMVYAAWQQIREWDEDRAALQRWLDDGGQPERPAREVDFDLEDEDDGIGVNDYGGAFSGAGDDDDC
jgi:hypothetical protein